MTRSDESSRDESARMAPSTVSLQAAAQLLAPTPPHDAEVELAHAIEHGELRASIQRWATEQWEGKQLPGNINRRETRIERTDLDAWLEKRRR